MDGNTSPLHADDRLAALEAEVAKLKQCSCFPAVPIPTAPFMCFSPNT